MPVINGAWSYTTVVLANGDYTFAATGKNAAGQESSPSAARRVMVLKNNGPTPPTINENDGCEVFQDAIPGLVPAEDPILRMKSASPRAYNLWRAGYPTAS